mgnify:CR=1 FL=1
MKPLILAVEDNEDLLYNLKLMLELNDYEVITAKNGEEALALLEKTSAIPNLIISDIMMPKMDGYAFFNELSNHPQLNQVPFIFLSAKSTPEEIRFGKMLGIDDYITKPFHKKDLLAVIKGKLQRSQKIKDLSKEFTNMLRPFTSQDQKPINLGEFFLILVEWDDRFGPELKGYYPQGAKEEKMIEEIGIQLFHASNSIYGHNNISKAQGILLRVENYNLDAFAYFDARPNTETRYGEDQYMLAIVGPNINYWQSIQLKNQVREISQSYKEKKKILIEEHWQSIKETILGSEKIKI